MDTFEQLFTNLSKGMPLLIKASIFPSIVYLFKQAIENRGITELEKILMSNFKKFQISLAKYSLLGIGLGYIYYLLLTSLPKEQLDVEKDFLDAVLLIALVSTLAVIFSLEVLIRGLFGTLSYKFDYYIVDEENKAVSRVIKLSDKKTLLVDSNGVEEFIDDFKKRKYKRIKRESEFLDNLYGYRKIKFILYGVIPAISLILGFLTYVTEFWVQFIFYLAFLLLLMIGIILLGNFKAFTQEKRGTRCNYIDIT